MFELLRMVMLIGFNPSGPDSADRVASEDGACGTSYQRVVHENPSNLADFNGVGTLTVHCADGNMPGRWDRPFFNVEATVEENSGCIFPLVCTA